MVYFRYSKGTEDNNMVNGKKVWWLEGWEFDNWGQVAACIAAMVAGIGLSIFLVACIWLSN